MIIYQNVNKFLEDNAELLEIPNELVRKGALELGINEIAQIMEMLHSSGIEFDSSIVPKTLGYLEYDFSFKSFEQIVDDFYEVAQGLSKEIILSEINNISPADVYSTLVEDQFLKRCYIRQMNWKQAKAPYIITTALTIDEQTNRIYTTLSINSHDLGSSIEIYYPKIAGKVLDNVGYMWNKDYFYKQSDSFKDQLERIFQWK